MILSQVLSDEVYPPILRKLGLPDDQQPLHLVMGGFGNIGEDLELAELWLRSELLMRSPGKIREAWGAVSTLRSQLQRPPLDLLALAAQISPEAEGVVAALVLGQSG